MASYMDDQNNKTVLLEGMYKGVAGKIEDMKQSVCKELKYSSTQQASSYEAIEANLKENLETVLAELRFLSQQNSAIYDMDQGNRTVTRDEIIRTVNEQVSRRIDALEERFTARFNELSAALLELAKAPAFTPAPAPVLATEPAPAEEVCEEPVQEASAEPVQEQPLSAETSSEETVQEDGIDYDVLAEKIATILPEVDYDAIAERVVSALPQTDENAAIDKFVAAIPPTDENAIADRVAEAVTPVDYDLITERVTSALENEFDVTINDAAIEKIALAVAEHLDYEKIYAYISKALEEFKAGMTVDADSIGQIALVVMDRLRSENAVVAAPVEEPAEEAEELVEEVAEEPAALSAPEVVIVPQPVEEPAEEPEEEELAATALEESEDEDAARPVHISVITEGEKELMTRYKRSFIAKICQSDETIKGYYSDLKNALMSYKKVHSQLNWSNDRFSYGGETVAKIGISGKTLCLYVALDPEEFPKTVYHQRYAGDKKMYEKTPMMLKVKSGVAVKRAVKLLELLMERNGAVKSGDAPVDYAAKYPYQSDEVLLREGQIKTALIVKSNLDF